MALNGASVPIGATYAPTGGAATSLQTLRSGGDFHKLLLANSPASVVEQHILYASTVEPKVNLQAASGYTKRKVRVELALPFELAVGGVYETDKLIVEMWTNIEADAARIALLREWLCHLGDDGDFDALFSYGSLA